MLVPLHQPRHVRFAKKLNKAQQEQLNKLVQEAQKIGKEWRDVCERAASAVGNAYNAADDALTVWMRISRYESYFKELSPKTADEKLAKRASDKSAVITWLQGLIREFMYSKR